MSRPLALLLLAAWVPLGFAAPPRPPALLPAPGDLVRYAVSDRPDGFVRWLWVSRPALEAARAGRELPLNTWLVIETYRARRQGSTLERDRAGHLIADRLERPLDVARKVGTLPRDFQNWTFARLDSGSRTPMNANTADCWICHQSADRRDFAFSLPALRRFAHSATLKHSAKLKHNATLERWDCDRPERQLCAHDFDAF